MKDSFRSTVGRKFEGQMKVLKRNVYAVHLNSKVSAKESFEKEKIKEDTICTYLLNPFMHTVVVQQQITTIELMKEQSKTQKKTKNERIKISCMKELTSFACGVMKSINLYESNCSHIR